MRVTAEIEAKQLSDLIKQVLAGDEVVLTQGNKPVAQLIPARGQEAASSGALRVRSLKGHRVLMPVISGADLADEMFDRQ